MVLRSPIRLGGDYPRLQYFYCSRLEVLLLLLEPKLDLVEVRHGNENEDLS